MPSHRRNPRLVAVVAVIIAALVTGPSTAAFNHLTAPAPISSPPASADLAPALAADGTFVGASAVNGTVDANAWRLVSNLATGEAPRFERANAASTARAARSPGAGGALTGQVITPDATEWSALTSTGASDGALNDLVNAVAVVGSNVYVAGKFTHAAGITTADFIARWDGSNWSALGSRGPGLGAIDAEVKTLAVMGSDLYVGGLFTNVANITTADYVARWNGSAWAALGSDGAGHGALSAPVEALAIAGSNLYVGGSFANAAGIATADRIASWNGSSWAALGSSGSGDGVLNNGVDAIAVSGSDVYVGGYFTDAAGNQAADYVARWDGSHWFALGSNGAGTNGALNFWVMALAVVGSNVYVGGFFTDAGGDATANYVARWNGSTWSGLGANGGALNAEVYVLAVSGTDLYVGGSFTNAAGIAMADYVARWNGSAWSGVGSNSTGTDGALTDTVDALAVVGAAVYVGGAFTDAAGIAQADRVVLALTPVPWSPLGSNGAGNGAFNTTVRALAVSGTDLYVGGSFLNAAGIATADHLARWNGSTWSALGSNNAGDGALTGTVDALAVSGSDLYVGGTFGNAAGIATADHLARWNGSTWSALGSNGAGDGALNNTVYALAVSGADLYVGGSFINAAGIGTADRVARWNGTTWSALGSNGAGDGVLNGTVVALGVSGTALFAGGQFTNAAGIADADYAARWNGSTWSALGSNGAGNGALNSTVYAFAFSGTNVYVGGLFSNAAGIATADRVARWNGSTWSALGSNGAGDGALNSDVYALAISGTDLYAGGQFTNAGGIATADRLARYNGSSWSAIDTIGANDGALNGAVDAVATSGTDVFVGGAFSNADGIPMADYVASVGPIAAFQPDGRIKKGSGTFVGDNIYNTDGTNQSKTGTAAVGSTITFTISIQNDGNTADMFSALATGAAAPNYQVKYFQGTTDITTAVVAGTYHTSSLAPGAIFAIVAKVKVLTGATVGSSVTRLVTTTSLGDGTKKDADRLTGSRA